MIKKTITIQFPGGLDERAIAHLVQKAGQYNSSLYFELGDKSISVKSIMGMMTLRLTEGQEVVVSADGEDEKIAVEGIQRFLENKND